MNVSKKPSASSFSIGYRRPGSVWQSTTSQLRASCTKARTTIPRRSWCVIGCMPRRLCGCPCWPVSSASNSFCVAIICPSRILAGSLIANVIVNLQVVRARLLPGIVATHAIDHELAKMIRELVVTADGPPQRRLDPGVVGIVEHISVALVQRPAGIVLVKDRISQSPHRAHDGHRAVTERDELRQSARLIPAGHDDHVGAGVNEMGQLLVVADFQMAIGILV